MRKIEFRAKAKNKKCWIVGDLIHCENGYSIIEKKGGCIKVKPKTIGQFTELCDKNGKKIYEGDIVKILYTDWASKSDNDTRTLEEYLDSLTKTGIVCWDNLSLCYCLKMKNGCYNSIHCGRYGYIEVVGNIYDNGGSDEECDN